MSFSGYVLNPQARLMLTVSTPVRQAGLQSRSLILNEDRGLLKGLERLLGSGLAETLARLLAGEDPGLGSLPAEHLSWLADLGVLVPQAELPRQPVYEPSLEALLAPAGTGDPAGPPPEGQAPLELNPTLLEQLAEEPPLALAQWLPGWQQLSPRRPLLWTREPRSQAWLPCWLSPELLSELKQSGLDRLEASRREALRAAGILLPASELDWFGPGRAARLASLRESLQAQAWLELRGLLPMLHRRALAAYCRQLGAEGFFQDGDPMVPERRIIHNETLMRYLHLQLTPFLQALVGEPLKASYALLADYGPGSVLRRHTDRSQCDWNLSLVLDQSAVWPFWIESPSGPARIDLAPGDLVFYSGTRTPHWRDALPAGQRVTVALFHFVSASYAGSLL